MVVTPYNGTEKTTANDASKENTIEFRVNLNASIPLINTIDPKRTALKKFAKTSGSVLKINPNTASTIG